MPRLQRELRDTIKKVLGDDVPPNRVDATQEVGPSDRTEKRKTCASCPSAKKRKTAYMCVKCKKPICLNKNRSKKICVGCSKEEVN